MCQCTHAVCQHQACADRLFNVPECHMSGHDLSGEETHRREGVLRGDNALQQAGLLGFERVLAKQHGVEDDAARPNVGFLQVQSSLQLVDQPPRKMTEEGLSGSIQWQSALDWRYCCPPAAPPSHCSGCRQESPQVPARKQRRQVLLNQHAARITLARNTRSWQCGGPVCVCSTIECHQAGWLGKPHHVHRGPNTRLG